MQFTTLNPEMFQSVYCGNLLKTGSELTVAVPCKANPDVVMFGEVEVLEELHLCSAVKGDQLHFARLAVVFRVRPRETNLPVVHKVTVAAIGDRETQTHPIARSRSGWKFL